MGEFLRKCVSRRLLALNVEKSRPSAAAMRHFGIGSQEGAEALAIFHQLIFDAESKWMKNCFALIEWGAVRNSASSLLPKHAAVAGCKNRALSYVEQEGIQPIPNDRGAEQADVDTPLEWSLALGMVAAEGRLSVCTPSWFGTHDSLHEKRLQDEQHSRMQLIHNFQPGGPEKLIGADDPRHAIQENGGLADFCYLDDGDVLCHTMLVLPYLQLFDTANAKIGAE